MNADEMPVPRKDSVCFVEVLNGKVIATVSVDPDHYDAQTSDMAWEWWYARRNAAERQVTSVSASPDRQPRHLELL